MSDENSTRPPDAPDAVAPTDALRPLLELGLDELREELRRQGEAPYHADQILRWLYRRRASTFEEMTDLAERLRERLAEVYRPFSSRVVTTSRSPASETTKLLLELRDGELIEAVLIGEGGRKTACVSTQVGCPVACAFCASGLDGVKRNLTSFEIIEQALAIQQLLPHDQDLTNIVVMGSGEPLLNEKNLILALEAFNDPKRLGLGARRITVSTVGFPERIRRLARLNIQFELAVSLHAPTDELRRKIIPGAKPIASILSATDDFTRTTGREITFEYVLLSGVNDSLEQARALARCLLGRGCLINLIPQNPVPGVSFEAPSSTACDAFRAVLTEAGFRTTLRKTKGRSIDAACGQLRRYHSAEGGGSDSATVPPRA